MKKHKKNRVIITIRIILLLIFIYLLLHTVYGIYEENQINTQADSKGGEVQIQENLNTVEEIKTKIMPLTPVVQEYKGYEVAARLEIKKIELKIDVIKNYSKQALEISATKFYGAQPNCVGNFCIAGHNKKNMFNKLSKLELGDEIILTDNENGIVTYQIYDKYKVKPNNISVLSQETAGEREITLITCTNYGQNRLIIKAKEK